MLTSILAAAAALFAASVSAAPLPAPAPLVLPSSITGSATFYTPGFGACGFTNAATDLVVAVAAATFDAFPGTPLTDNSLNPICGKTVTATSGGKTVQAKVVDRCAGCLGAVDLSFSPAAFDALASPTSGPIAVTWSLA
ncbi:hypothetical protein BV25DRAFT_1920753 [Artomyces pyxidatus]|uniref:Uncharacterized protein n=1 Tax=Artomyces pyxidatus TaxID=48021 RepID=A0ACB8SKF0_9AGAM|nr:hypothetical protein BV25DRAFT_1920753 [Artomyces pyxidatus]